MRSTGPTSRARSRLPTSAAERAAATEDEADAALAHTVAALARMNCLQCSPDEVERLAREALPLLEAADDDDGLVHAWYALAWVANMRQRFEEWAQAMETAMRHARRAGHPVLGVFALALAVPLTYGPRPASEALATLDAVLADHPVSGRPPDASAAARDARPDRRGLGGRPARGGAPP